MKLKFELREAYGRQRYYPANDEADGLCLVAERKCLSPRDLDALRDSGFSVVIVSERADREELEEEQSGRDAESVREINERRGE